MGSYVRATERQRGRVGRNAAASRRRLAAPRRPRCELDVSPCTDTSRHYGVSNLTTLSRTARLCSRDVCAPWRAALHRFPPHSLAQCARYSCSGRFVAATRGATRGQWEERVRERRRKRDEEGRSQLVPGWLAGVLEGGNNSDSCCKYFLSPPHANDAFESANGADRDSRNNIVPLLSHRWQRVFARRVDQPFNLRAITSNNVILVTFECNYVIFSLFSIIFSSLL